MALPPERPLADPLLEPDTGPRDASGAPVRAPIGNSIKTLLLLGALVVVGVAVWWVQRPEDLTERIGGREWAIVDVGGEPAVNQWGMVSTFVLDGDREARGMADCNTWTGRWSFETSSQRLDIESHEQTAMFCQDWPATYTIDSGAVRVDGAVMTVDTEAGAVRSIALGGMAAAAADELAGEWESGATIVELGPRGLVRVDGCTGSWMAVGDGISVAFDEPESCDLAPIWTGDAVIVPVRFEQSLFLHRDTPSYPLDRQVHRLDLIAEAPG